MFKLQIINVFVAYTTSHVYLILFAHDTLLKTLAQRSEDTFCKNGWAIPTEWNASNEVTFFLSKFYKFYIFNFYIYVET